MWRYQVFEQKVTWYFIGVYIIIDINPLSRESDQQQFSPNNIYTWSRERLWESMKWSPKGRCLDLLSNSLNWFFKEMYGDQAKKGKKDDIQTYLHPKMSNKAGFRHRQPRLVMNATWISLLRWWLRRQKWWYTNIFTSENLKCGCLQAQATQTGHIGNLNKSAS